MTALTGAECSGFIKSWLTWRPLSAVTCSLKQTVGVIPCGLPLPQDKLQLGTWSPGCGSAPASGGVLSADRTPKRKEHAAGSATRTHVRRENADTTLRGNAVPPPPRRVLKP